MRNALTLTLGLLFMTAGVCFAEDKPINTVCPKCGEEVDGKHVAKVKNDDDETVAIAVCSEKCKKTVEKDAAKYLEAAKENKKVEE